MPAERARATVLFCHGNAGDIGDQVERAKVFHDMGLSVLVFDYRGYGKSEGKPSEKGLYEDAEGAWRYLTEVKKIPAEKIIVAGHSLGGPVAAHVAKEHKPVAVVLESTFTTMDDEVEAKTSKMPVTSRLPVSSLVDGEFRTQEFLAGVHCPLLVVHSKEDAAVAYKLGWKLYERANGPKEFLEINGTHNRGFETSGRVYTDGWTAFLDKYLGK